MCSVKELLVIKANALEFPSKFESREMHMSFCIHVSTRKLYTGKKGCDSAIPIEGEIGLFPMIECESKCKLTHKHRIAFDDARYIYYSLPFMSLWRSCDVWLYLPSKPMRQRIFRGVWVTTTLSYYLHNNGSNTLEPRLLQKPRYK